MKKERLREIVEQAIAAVVAAEVAQRLQNRPRRALLVYTGAMIGFGDTCEQLSMLRRQGYRFDALLSESAAAVLNRAAIESAARPDSFEVLCGQSQVTALTGQYEVVIIPQLTVRSAAHLAALLADSPATRLVQDALLRGKQVVACRDGCCPDCWAELGYTMTPGLQQAMVENLRKLQSYGMRLSRGRNLCRALQAAPGREAAAARPAEVSGRVIGAGQIAACAPGSTLRVAREALLTSLAREQAAARGIRIVRE